MGLEKVSAMPDVYPNQKATGQLTDFRSKSGWPQADFRLPDHG
jgi:hypothetical protein